MNIYSFSRNQILHGKKKQEETLKTSFVNILFQVFLNAHDDDFVYRNIEKKMKKHHDI